jgi:hypothetical protein
MKSNLGASFDGGMDDGAASMPGRRTLTAQLHPAGAMSAASGASAGAPAVSGEPYRAALWDGITGGDDAGTPDGGLPAPLRSRFEGSLGVDLGGVRLHTDGAAARSAESIDARAYTRGNDIHFAAGAYDPGSHAGQLLLAHEVAHVAQQQGASPHQQAKRTVGAVDDPLEHEADDAAAAMIDGRATSVSRGQGADVIRRWANPAQANAALAVISSATPAQLQQIIFALETERARERSVVEIAAEVTFPGLWRGNLALDDLPGIERAAHQRFRALPQQSREPTQSASLPDSDPTPPAPPPPAPPPPPATATWDVVVSHGGAAAHDASRASVGDTITVRARLSNATGGPVDTTGTHGQHLELRSHGFAAPDVYELQLAATSVGPGMFHLRLGVGGGAVEHDLVVHVEMERARWRELAVGALAHVVAGYMSTQAYMIPLARAYGRAWSQHAGALRAADARIQAAERALAAQREAEINLLFGAALAFVPGGAGGVLGASVRAAGGSDFMVDGVKDLLKWGLRTAGGWIAGPIAGVAGAPASGGPTGNFTPMPADPSEWEHQMGGRIAAEQAQVAREVASWIDRVNANDPTFFLDFDPSAEVQRTMTMNGRPVEQLGTVNVEESARALESAFWQDWINRYGYTTVTELRGRNGDDGTIFLLDFPREVSRASNQIPAEVEARCRAVGLDTEQASAAARQRAERDAAEQNRRRGQ